MTFTLLPAPDSLMGSEAGNVKWYTRVAAFLAVASPTVRFDGADISHHQDDAGPINWDALRAAGGWIAFKATQGLHYVDPTFLAHRDNARARRFTHRIFYHWLDPDTDPVAQAVHFLSVVGRLEPGDGVMLDVEQSGVTAAQVLAWCQFVESVTKRPVVIYTGAYTAGGTIWQSTAVRLSPYGPRAMHFAAYTTETRARSLPGVGAYPWSGWQYSSSGPVPGIVGRCDMNRIDNWDHYNLACGIAVAPPVHQEDDDMPKYFTVAGAKAAFIGSNAMVEWTGPGDDKIAAGIQAQLAAGNLVHEDLTGGPMAFSATILKGPLPTGDVYAWTGDEFSNAAQIRAAAGATVDAEARVMASQAHDAADGVMAALEGFIAKIRAAVVA